MLSRMPSRELTEWMAYERHSGPIGDSWRDETLAEIHELLQFTNHLLGQAHFTDKHHKKGPAPKPEPYARPPQLYEVAKRRAEREAREASEKTTE